PRAERNARGCPCRSGPRPRRRRGAHEEVRSGAPASAPATPPVPSRMRLPLPPGSPRGSSFSLFSRTVPRFWSLASGAVVRSVLVDIAVCEVAAERSRGFLADSEVDPDVDRITREQLAQRRLVEGGTAQVGEDRHVVDP